MADPLSVAGSAVGIISLGIQVAQSLFDYYNAVKSQHSDVAHTIRKLDSLLEILGSLQHRIDDRRFRADEQDAVRKIESLINESEECIQELQDEAEKFKQCPVGTIQSAVRTTARRVAYPFRRSTLEKLDEDVDDIVDRLKLALQLLQQEVTDRVQDDVEDIKALLKLVKSSQDSSGIQQWLNAPDATTNFNEACAKRQPQTGLWLVKGQRFTDWLTSHGSFLWLRGFAGCGKSVLCSTAIQHTYRHRRSNPQIGIAFFFFTFNDESKQDTSALLRALVLQLSTQAATSTHLARLRDSYRQAAPPDEALLGCLRQFIGTFQDVYILIDALDESPQDKHREAVLQLLTDIRAWQEPRLHLLVTSRDEVDIRDELDLDPSLVIEMRNSEVDQDITAFIRQTLQDDRRLVKWKKHHSTIQDVLTQRANGMFRWVECQCRSLARCPPNQQLLEQLLHSLPKSLDDTYARMLENIAPNLVDYAKQMLTILCCAIRPLSDTELLDALAVRIDTDCSDDYSYDVTRRFNDISALEEICPGFMEVDTEFDTRGVTIRLAHFSVQEFLEAKRILQYETIALFHVQKQTGHTHMAGICLASLLYPQQKGDKAFSEVTEESALLKYAARHWPDHFTQCGSKSLIEMQSLPLFQATSPYFMRWVRTWNIKNYHGDMEEETPEPLYYVAILGLTTVAGVLLGSSNMNVKSPLAPDNDSTMHAISRTETCIDHTYVLESLSEDIDVNVKGELYGMALEGAAAKGHESVVQLLLDKGANVNAEGGVYGTPLQAAAANGHESVMQLLLDKGANVNAKGGVYGTALQKAAANGYKSVVQLLLDKGANVNARGGICGTPLQAAAAGGHERIVQLLLDKGANVNAEGIIYGTPLQEAAAGGHQSIMQMLLDNYADARGNDWFVKALGAAAAEGNESAVQMLLDNYADADAGANGWFVKALQEAATGGHKGIVQLLFDQGADANYGAGEWSVRALKAAAAGGHEGIVQLFLDQGVDINGGAKEWPGSALRAAAAGGHEGIVQLLLDQGADVNCGLKEWPGSALKAAAAGGYEGIVQLLLDQGADVNCGLGLYETALHAAEIYGQETIMQLLLNRGADVDIETGVDWDTPRPDPSTYEVSRRKSIVKLLLDDGATKGFLESDGVIHRRHSL